MREKVGALEKSLEKEREITRKKKVRGWYRYTVRGILEKPSPAVTSIKAVVIGRCHEQWSESNGKIVRKCSKQSRTIIPDNLWRLHRFLEDIPTGTEIVFKEAAGRFDGETISHSYSIEVVSKKKRG